MPSKFAGRCAECNGPIAKGEEIEYANKKAYHPRCSPGAEPEPQRRSGVTAEELAESLGYAAADRMDRDWALWFVSWRDRKPASASDRSDNAAFQPAGNAEGTGPGLFGMSQEEN